MPSFLRLAAAGEPTAALVRDAPQPAQTSVLPRRSHLTPWDLVGMLAGFALTLAITVVNSRGRVFWEDELLGWMLLRDPSWHHMIHAWNLGADGGGFSFYLLCRAWFALVGASPLTFRLFSGVCFGLAFAAIWAGLRRVYPLGIVAFAAFNSLFFSPPITMHIIEGRFYGLLVMSTALAVWLALRLDDTTPPVPARLYLAGFLIHGLLTTSHVLGVVFSAFILLGTFLLDRLAHRFRPGLYLSIAASWLLLLPEKTSIVAAGRVGKPHFWTRAPILTEVIGAFSGFSREIALVLALLAAFAAVSLWRTRYGLAAALRREVQSRRAVYILTGCLFLVPCAFFAQGVLGGTWLFNSRYLQPVIVAVAYLTAELAYLATRQGAPLSFDRPPLRLASRALTAALFTAFMLFWVFHHVAEVTPEMVDYTGALTARLPHDLPVVVEDAFTFTSLLSRQADSGVHYVFLLDWPYAVAPGSPRLEVTQYHLMENWARAGYFPGTVQDAATFLRNNPRFLTLHDDVPVPEPRTPPEIGNPVAERLAHTPGYEVRPFLELDRPGKTKLRDTVRLVCRGSCGPA